MGLVAVVIAGRSGWYYEWDRAMSWASASTILLGPLVAGLLAFDVARRLGPTLGVLIATTRRGLHGVLALALVVWAFGTGGWLLGAGYAAIRTAQHGATGPVDPWIFVQAPTALLACAGIGLVVGLLVRNVMAAPLAAGVVYLAPITLRPLADAGVLASNGATGSLAGLETNPRVAVAALAVNLLIAMVAAAVAAIRLLPRTRGPYAAATVLGVGLLGATTFLLSLDPMMTAYRPTAEPPTCLGTTTRVCGPAESGALLRIAARDLDEARSTLRDAGVDTVPEYRLATPGADLPATGVGMLSITTDGLESGHMGDWDLAVTLATPSACPAYWADLPPEELLDTQRHFADWVIEQLAEPQDDADPARALAWYDDLTSCQGSPP